MIESKGVNNNLWAKSPQHRDNGVLTIGTCVVILNTLPVDSELAGIPMVACDGGCIILKRPLLFKEVRINSDMRQNDTKSFVYNNVQLAFTYAAVFETDCNGLLCDRQRSHEIKTGSKGCGCYSSLARLTKLVVGIDFSFDVQNLDIEICKFSSHQFSKFFLSDDFPPDVTRNAFDGNTRLDALSDCIDNVFDRINGNGGFTVIGWYKLGDKTDVSNKETNTEVHGKLTFHVITLIPTRREIIGDGTLDVLKFDVTTLY